MSYHSFGLGLENLTTAEMRKQCNGNSSLKNWMFSWCRLIQQRLFAVSYCGLTRKCDKNYTNFTNEKTLSPDTIHVVLWSGTPQRLYANLTGSFSQMFRIHLPKTSFN